MDFPWQFDLGRKAGLADRAPHSNPFPRGVQHDAWRAGWQQGQMERQKAVACA